MWVTQFSSEFKWIGKLLPAFLILTVSWVTQQARADDSYPPVRLAQNDIRIIANPRVETDLIMHLIANAKKRIRLGTFHFQPDDLVGWPVLKELEKAAAKGVKVEFFTSNFAGWNGDMANYTGYFLDYISSYTSLEYAMVGANMSGWYYSDGVHAKELIIDDEIAMITGRGYGKTYHSWFDIAYIFKGDLAKQSIQTYKRLWSDIRIVEASPYSKLLDRMVSPPSSLREPEPALKGYWDAFTPREGILSRGEVEDPKSEKFQLKSLTDWAETPASAPGDGIEFQARTLHHRFLRQMEGLPKKANQYDYPTRLGMLEDTVVDAVADRIKNAKREIKIMSFATIFHPTIKAALIGALQRGVNIEIITNGKAAHSMPMQWWNLWTPAGHYLSLPDTDDLLSVGNSVKTPGKLSVYHFKSKNSGSDFHYTHAKLIIIDDVTFFGSHNITVTSTVAQEEIQWEVVGKEFSDDSRKIFEEAKGYTEPLKSNQAACERNKYWSRFQSMLCNRFSWLY